MKVKNVHLISAGVVSAGLFVFSLVLHTHVVAISVVNTALSIVIAVLSYSYARQAGLSPWWGAGGLIFPYVAPFALVFIAERNKGDEAMTAHRGEDHETAKGPISSAPQPAARRSKPAGAKKEKRASRRLIPATGLKDSLGKKDGTGSQLKHTCIAKYCTKCRQDHCSCMTCEQVASIDTTNKKLLETQAEYGKSKKHEVRAAKAPVFRWGGSDYEGSNPAQVDKVRQENQSAIKWFNAQNFVPIPTDGGEQVAATYCFDMASIAQNKGLYQEAWAGFHQALRRFAGLNDERMLGLTCFNLGKVYGARDNWEMAQLMFLQSAYLTGKIGDEKGHGWSLAYLGDTSDRVGDKLLATEVISEALSIFKRVSPENVPNLEKALRRLKNISKEDKRMSDDKESNELEAKAHYYLDRKKEGKFDQVIAELTPIISKLPNNSELRKILSNTYLDRGAANYKQGNDDKALADFEKATKIDQKNWKALVNLSSLYMASCHWKEALNAMEKAFEINPELNNNPGVVERREQMRSHL